ncbi:response regulator [SCandidatus Aminicenantes bacterium Aminicenantia_JdfR_composite]|jgi:two-component system response regulator AtoC|nr:response regulator [SCandidatus Aminicenantes bacterium Aminicenantia_JdfR_composite]
MAKKILIVDDEKLIRWSLTKILTQSGYEVKAVESGEEALKEIDETSYDLVFTDLKMTGIDGIEVLKEIQKVSPKTKVVIITAYGTPQVRSLALKFKAFSFIDKPFKAEQIKTVARSALGNCD